MNWMDFITFLAFMFNILAIYVAFDMVVKENKKLKKIIKRQTKMIQELKDKSS